MTAKLRLSASAIQLFSECRQKYFLSKVLKVGPAVRATALEFGSAMDAAIRTLYSNEWNVQEAQRVFSENYTEDPADTKRTLETGRLIIQRYALAYKDQPIKIVSQGFTFSLDVRGQNVEIVGELDRVIEQCGRLMPSEFKTTSQLTADYMKKFWWDVQTALYLIAARQFIDPKVTGVQIDAVLVAKSDPSKLKSAALLRDIIEHDVDELDYMRMRIEQIVAVMVEAHQAWEGGSNDLWIENDQACTNYGGCQYLGYCRYSPKVRNSILRNDFVNYQADPAAFEKFKNCKQGILEVK